MEFGLWSCAWGRLAVVWVLMFLVMGSAGRVQGQPTGNTVGLMFQSPAAQEGYTLFGPNATTDVYLIDLKGELIRRWRTSFLPGVAAYLLEDGHLLRSARFGFNFLAGGAGGRIEEYDWEGNMVWGFDYSTTEHRHHHDAIKLPNGNVLMIAWELKSSQQAIAAGRNPALLVEGVLWPDTLIEVRPLGGSGGEIVWEWHVWDHLVQDFDAAKENYGVVAAHPERVDVNYTENGRADWMHVNGMDYNEALDQVMISIHAFDEIWVIDHSTTTAEAAGRTGGLSGKGGDLLYRWGNPRTYRAGTVADQKLFGQHNPNWIRPGLARAGHILIFNNGNGRPGGNYSTIEEIIPPLGTNGNYDLTPGSAYGPGGPVWRYEADPPATFYGQNISGAQRLPNGNTLICEGPKGNFFEVTAAESLAWQYICPVRSGGVVTQGAPSPNSPVFRAVRYPSDYPAFDGKDMRSLGPVELPQTYEFVFVAIERTAEGQLLSWASQPDRVYTVQFRGLEAGSDWENVATVTSIGNRVHYLDSDSGRFGGPGGVYRAVIVP